MASNFKPPAPSREWAKGENFASAEEATEALLNVAPKLRCPICSTEVFILEEDFERSFRTALNRFEFPFGDPRTFDAQVSLSCNNCGYVMSFIEEKLKSKMSRRG